MLNEFIQQPIIVHEMDFMSESGKSTPYIKNTMVFLGDVPGEVLHSAESMAASFSSGKIKEGQLKSFYGATWKNKIGLVTKGGADLGEELGDVILDLGDELDHIDLLTDEKEVETLDIETPTPAAVPGPSKGSKTKKSSKKN